jgi:uridine phosphorylase
MNRDMQLPLLRVRPRDLAPRALVVGDPAKATDAALVLDHAQELCYWRECRTFASEYKGRRIVVSSHGVGSAGAAVCFEKLIHGGVHTLIRAGTCGAVVKEIEDVEFMIATAAVRDDGTAASALKRQCAPWQPCSHEQCPSVTCMCLRSSHSWTPTCWMQ